MGYEGFQAMVRNAKKTKKSMHGVVTMGEVAERAGYSRYTVSKVLNGDATVADATRERVLRICKDLNYVPNPHAVSLVRKHSNSIGMVVTYITDPFYGEIIRAAEHEAASHGLQLLVQCSYGDAEKEKQIIATLRILRVCGLVIAPVVPKANRKLLNELETQIPVVCVDRYLRRQSSFVMNDNIASSAMLVERLISRGVAPAYLGSSHGLQNVAACQREQGYLRTMQRHRKEPVLVPLTTGMGGEDTAQFGYDNMAAWLRQGARPSGLFCATDSLSLGAMKALHEVGLTPGRDVLVAGHDDLGFSAYTQPSITTARQPKEQIGRAAVQIVADKIEGKIRPGENVQRTFPSELVIRESA
jgi:DNA-binding LacI/PurR family transcriptional regulator